MKKNGTLADLRVCIEKALLDIDEKFRKYFEEVAADMGSPENKALHAVQYHKMMMNEAAPLRKALAELKRMEAGS